MDQRRHPRLHLRLPIRFIVEQPEARDSQAGQGMLKNISYGGILFQAEPPLPVQRGHIREFSFYLNPDTKKEGDSTHFHARDWSCASNPRTRILRPTGWRSSFSRR